MLYMSQPGYFHESYRGYSRELRQNVGQESGEGMRCQNCGTEAGCGVERERHDTRLYGCTFGCVHEPDHCPSCPPWIHGCGQLIWLPDDLCSCFVSPTKGNLADIKAVLAANNMGI